MSLFKDFGETELSKLAARIDEIQELRNSGNLTEEEFVELIEDLKRESEVLEACQDMDMKSNFLKAVNALSKLI